MKMDYIDIGGIIAVLINYFVYVPLIIYLYMQYRQYRKAKIMRFREPIVLYLMYGIFLLTFLIERLWPLLTRVWCVVSAPNWTFWLFWSSTFFCYDLFAIKCYHLYFQQEYHLENADLCWKQELNINHLNWYISHKSTFGNSIYLIKIALIPFFIVIIIETIGGEIFGESSLIFDIIRIIILSIPICFAYYLFYRAKYIDDIYGIRKEILYQVIAETFAIIITILFFIIIHTIPSIYNYSEIARLEFLLYVIFFTPLYFLPLIIFNTGYPIYLHRETLKTRIKPSIRFSISSKFRHHGEMNIVSPTKKKRKKTVVSMTQSISNMTSIIKNKRAFKEFMRYLVLEFSTENLLFICELVMVKYKYQLKCNNIIKIPKYMKLLTQINYRENMNVNINNNNNNNNNKKKRPTLIKIHSIDSNELDGNGDDDDNIKTPPSTLQLSQYQESSNNNDEYMTIDFNINITKKDIEERENNNNIIFNDEDDIDSDNGPLGTYLFDEYGNIVVKLFIPRQLPPSSISQLNGLYNQMFAIFNKYIKSGASHEINLSSHLRYIIEIFFNDINKRKYYTQNNEGKEKEYKLFNLLDSVGLEILRLMSDSFGRFQTTKAYHDVYNDDIENDAVLASASKELFNQKLPVIRNATSYEKLMSQYVIQ